MSVRVKLDHFGLYVKDMERTIRWYHDVLGFRLSDYLPPGNTDEPAAPDGIAWMRLGELHHDLTIVQYPPEALADDKPRRAGNLQQLAYHLATEEEVEAAYEAVVSAGVPIVKPLGRGPLLGILQFYMADPDGNKIEVFSTPGLAEGGTKPEKAGFIHVERFSHVGVNVRDMPRSAAFYEEMLGFRTSDRRSANPPEGDRLPPHGIAWMTCSGEHHNLVLVQLPPEEIDQPLPFGGRGALQQIAFTVETEEDVHAAYEHVAARGAEIMQKPRPQNWSAGVKFYFRDPDGNKLEIESGMKRVDPDYGGQYAIAKKIAAGASS